MKVFSFLPQIHICAVENEAGLLGKPIDWLSLKVDTCEVTDVLQETRLFAQPVLGEITHSCWKEVGKGSTETRIDSQLQLQLKVVNIRDRESPT